MYLSVLSLASMTLPQNSSRHLLIASYCEELYYSAVLNSCLAEMPLDCINSYGRFFGLLSEIVHLCSSILKAGSFFSSSSSAGGCLSSSSSSPSPTGFFSTTTGSGNSSYYISYSSMYSFSELNYNPITAKTSPMCLSIWNNSSINLNSRRSLSNINFPELQNPSINTYL